MSKELTEYTNPTYGSAYYDIDEVNALLAEKDAFIKTIGEGQAELASEIERLKSEIESLKTSHYAEMVDAGMRERMLKRALWMARSERADSQFIYWCARFANESGFSKFDIRGYGVNTHRKLRAIRDWMKIWKNVERKCRAMAEKFKEAK